jgi:DnaJ family protein A protein 2
MTTRETKLYELLGVSPNATQDDIKKAFRKKSLIHHPDKGGDVEIYKQINSAYEVLSDPDKRKLYDEHGENGLRDSGGISEDMLSNMFGNMFSMNGGFPFGGGTQQVFQGLFNMYTGNKSELAIHKYKVTLENLCRRRVVKLKLTRDKICKNIDESKIETCNICKGRGVVMEIKKLLPNVIHQVQTKCDVCKGRGKIYPTCDMCIDGITKEPKIFELHLNPELEDGYKYVFKNEGNQEPGKQPGDFIVILQYEDHPLFKIENKNLLYTHTLTLKEALCGHKLEISHPSGEIISISTDDVTNPDTVETIENKGLSYEGKFIIKYRVKFPEAIDKKNVDILSKIL